MDERRYRLAGGGLMLVAAGLVVASLRVEQVTVRETSVPVLVLAVGVYLLGVAAIAPVHLRAGDHRRLLVNLLLGVGVLLFAWSAVDGPEVAAGAGLLALLAAGALLSLAGREDDGEGGPDDATGDATEGAMGPPATEP